MNTKKHVNSCIDALRSILGDSNSELSSEQQGKLKKGIRDLKRLRQATKLTHSQVIAVVNEIAEAAFQLLRSGRGE